jgi:hypothetical protein
MSTQHRFPWAPPVPGTAREPGTTRRGKVTGSLVPTGSPLVPGTGGASGSRFPPLEGEPGNRSGNRSEGVREFFEQTPGTAPQLEAVPAAHDVLKLETRWLGALPERAGLRCLASGGRVAFYITSSRRHWQALRRSGVIVFGLLELDALTHAVACDRVNPASLLTWCAYKQHTPAWRLTVSEALGGAYCKPDPDPHHLTIGAVLKALGATLIAVEWPA